MNRQRFLFPLLLVLAVLGGGTAGYMLIEGWGVVDSLFMTVITVATVGYGEVHPLSHPGRIYTIILILVGMGTLLYGVTVLTAFVVEGGLQGILRRRKMKKMLGKMKGHTIICGAGRTGRHVIEELAKTKLDFVVIDGNREIAERMRERGIVVIEGDATHEECLKEAGVEKAGRMVVSLTDDKDNLFVVLTARGMNPTMRIVARYVDDRSAEKMRKAGANATVSPNAIGGLRMASEALRPSVVSFLDIMLRSSKATLRVEEARVCEGSKLAGKALRESAIPDHTGLLVLAIRGENDEYLFNPNGRTVLTPGLTLIVMGEMDGVKKLKLLSGEVKA